MFGRWHYLSQRGIKRIVFDCWLLFYSEISEGISIQILKESLTIIKHLYDNLDAQSVQRPLKNLQKQVIVYSQYMQRQEITTQLMLSSNPMSELRFELMSNKKTLI